jgi:hypothetical protein
MTISILCSNYTEPNLMTLDIEVYKLMNYMFKYAKYTVYLSLLEQYNTLLRCEQSSEIPHPQPGSHTPKQAINDFVTPRL